jgi:hypothetical protein
MIWEDSPDDWTDFRPLRSSDGKTIAWGHVFAQGAHNKISYYGVAFAERGAENNWAVCLGAAIKFGTYLAVTSAATAEFRLSQDGTFDAGRRNGKWRFRDGTIDLTFSDGRQHQLKMLTSRIFTDNKGLTLVWQSP